MSGFTPGPWLIRKAKHPVDGAWDWAIGVEVNEQPYCIAEAFGRAAEDIFLPAEANARLIAAAPELLEACEDLFKWFDKSGSSISARWDRIPPEERVKIVNHFRAAIAKARSES